jgi:hypothetical protein
MFLTAALPSPGYFSAIEHARRFDGDPEARMRQASWWKGQGVKAGLADLMVWYRQLFVGVELKVGRNKATEAEKEFGRAMQANGFSWVVCYSVAEVDAALRAAGIPIARSMQIAAQEHDLELAQPAPAKKRRTQRAWTEEELAEAQKRQIEEFEQFLSEMPGIM